MLDELIHSLYILQASSNVTSQQPDFWRDPIWQAVGVISSNILAILGLVLTAFFALKQRKRKILTFEIISTKNIIEIADNSIQGQLEIFYQRRQIENLYVITIKFINSGNVEITLEDYKGIWLYFGRDAKVLAIESIEASSGVPTPIFHWHETPDGQCTHIEPVLLNKKDFLNIQLLVTRFQSVFVTSKIAGGEVREATGKQNSFPSLNGVIMLLASLLLLQNGYRELSLILFSIGSWESINYLIAELKTNKK